MISRAIDMIFSVSADLKDRGWKYQMEGQFLEVYNEVVSAFPVIVAVKSTPCSLVVLINAQINDLLGTGQFDTKKHEIKHDKEGKMSVTDAVSGMLPISTPRDQS